MHYDKDKIKEQITTSMIQDLVADLGGEPKPTDFGFIARTICHNHYGEGSHKLYYYENTKLFRCYTGCDSTFDIFELICKVHNLSQEKQSWTLYNGMQYVVNKLNLEGANVFTPDEDTFEQLSDWKIFEKYDRIKISQEDQKRIELKEYNVDILKHLLYLRIANWEDEGISSEVIKYNQIGFCPSTDQITIPHFDENNRFIGLRGRTLGKEEAELYGKYRPMFLNGQMYNHPLGLNLYNLNNSKSQISKIKKAIVFEGEKSCLLYQSYFGIENDISVACCGSAISSWQINKLIEYGAIEIIIAFDRQFQKIGDEEYDHWTKNLNAINLKYSNYVKISFIIDIKNKLRYKDSPIDRGADIFKELFKDRVNI